MMQQRFWRGWVLGVAAFVVLAACELPRPTPVPTVLADEDRLEWATEEPWFIVIRTSCRTLDVYRRGERVRSYDAVFGLGGASGKLHEGDRRTPTGLYSIVDIRRHAR